MESFWSLPSYWISIVLAVLTSIGLSAFIQLNNDTQELKNKALVRDGILGAIFTTIVWVMSPETMTSLSSGVKNMVGGVQEATQTLGNTASSYKLGDVDVQVGPAKF